jgi:epsilon-lactone hydrolase
MASPEFAQLIAGLRAGGPDLSASPEVARAGFTAMVSAAPLAADVQVSRTRLGGVDTLVTATPGADVGRTLLYLHGGAFVIGSAEDYQTLSAELGRAAGIRALSLNYRLAPEHPFPAAVDDALAAYRALLDQGHSATSIVVAGDSAGGGLALSLLVATRDAGLPQPAAALLISPWVDLACTGETMHSNAEADPSLQREGLIAMATHYLQGRSAALPLASPLHAPLHDLAPLLIQVGSAEILLADATRLATAAAAADVRVSLQSWPEMVHVWHFFGFMLPEGRAAIAEAGHFLRQHLQLAQIGIST